jgi:hypothetical protein
MLIEAVRNLTSAGSNPGVPVVPADFRPAGLLQILVVLRIWLLVELHVNRIVHHRLF